MKWTRFAQLTILFFAVVVLFAGWYEEAPDYSKELTTSWGEFDSILVAKKGIFGDTSSQGNGMIVSPTCVDLYHDTLRFRVWGAFPDEYKLAGIIYGISDQALVIASYSLSGVKGSVKIAYDDSWYGGNVGFTATDGMWRPDGDTLDDLNFPYRSGTGSYRWLEVFSRYFRSSSPSRADTLEITIDEDTTWYNSENPNKFNNELIIDGCLTSDSLNVGGGVEVRKIFIRNDSLFITVGTDSFVAIKK